jgi:hypothetical protein
LIAIAWQLFECDLVDSSCDKHLKSDIDRMNLPMAQYFPGNYRASFASYQPHQASYVSWAVQMIMYIVGRVGPREPSSAQELAAQNIMADELRKYCDSVTMESFTVRPGCLMAWVYLVAALMIVAAFLYNFKFRITAFILTAIAAALWILEFIMYKEFIDPFYPAHESENVIGIIKPKGPVQRRIIFNGHADSMYEWWYNYLGGHQLFALVVLSGVIAIISSVICQIYYCSEYSNCFAIVLMVELPIWGALLFFTSWNRIVQGANDNLSGCLAAMSVAKYMSDNNINFLNTEVRIVITGCEESGLRGAKAYGRAHPPDGIDTAWVAFDTIRDLDKMRIYNRDMTMTVALDQRVCNIMQKGGQLGGLNLDFGWIVLGSTDAAAAQQAGIPAGAFVAMDMSPADFYHTRRDAIDNMEPLVIGHAMDLAIGSALIFDEEGLNGGLDQQLK